MMRGLAAPTAAPPAASVRPSWRTSCAPSRNGCAWPLAIARLSIAHPYAAVDRQSRPRPDSRHLRQPALEGLTNSARTETPRQADRNKSDQRTRRRGSGTLAAARPREGGRGEGRPSGLWRLGIQLAMRPQPLRLRNHNFGLAQRIMVKRLATSPHDPLGITDSACKNQLVVVSVQYGPFNTYIPIRSTTIGKSRVARDPIAMHTSWRSNSDIASVTSWNEFPSTGIALIPKRRRLTYVILNQQTHFNTQQEGSTKRFDGYRPSANTQSSSLAPGELLATPITKQSQLLFTTLDKFQTAFR
ncbi:hypothetical protein F511_21769 [Dorcoceras hygrometricum]|uniref:Uncharacterized protein n=1 Tax=Dorcoceras hygrometricum TaxID=472368 RepID=A0A2Z7AGF9_9LAMI|nr:hypothetical protein F511_21769 [Dorcoceras hygrometricum]